MEKTNRIDLSSDDRQRLKDLTTSGTMKVRALKRAPILLKADSSPDGPAWSDSFDGTPGGLLRALDEIANLRVDVSDEIGRVRVAVHAADERRDVNVADVAVLQNRRVGDAVTDDFVE